jgi:hypothetical protein
VILCGEVVSNLFSKPWNILPECFQCLEIFVPNPGSSGIARGVCFPKRFAQVPLDFDGERAVDQFLKADLEVPGRRERARCVDGILQFARGMF